MRFLIEIVLNFFNYQFIDLSFIFLFIKCIFNFKNKIGCELEGILIVVFNNFLVCLNFEFDC